MSATVIAIAIGVSIMLAARLLAGRVASLSTTAICGATIAYLLPPVYSFHVDETAGLVALTLFGALGLVVSGVPKRSRSHPVNTPLEFIHRATNHPPLPRYDHVLALAQQLSPAHISVSIAYAPDHRRITVIAHRHWPSLDGEIVITGKPAAHCTLFRLPDAPPNTTAAWFDTPAGRVFHIYVASGE